MKELSRFELAIVKRTAQNTKSLRVKRDKLVAKIEEAQAQLDVVNTAIEGFEAPIKAMTGGFTSEEVLNKAMENTEDASACGNVEPVDNTEAPAEAEVPAEEAASIPEEAEFPLG